MSEKLIDNKEVLKEYDFEKNIDIELDKLTIGTHKKVWWICPKNHSFQQEVRSKVKGISCPICSNKLVLKGYNDLATTHPELLKEWDYKKNNIANITPHNITKGAEKKVWWICNHCKQSYQNFAYSKKANVGCPYCSSKIIKKGLNDIFTKKPNWENNWDYKKNNISPYTISVSSHKNVWWICDKCGKSFLRKVSDIDGESVLCKECSIDEGVTKRIENIISKKGSFMDNYHDIAKEWDYQRNDITPDKITSNSKFKAYWICPNGHSYQSTLSHRINGRGCPICSKEMSISFPEKAIFYYISKIEKNIVESYKPDFLNGKEIDIYLPDKNIGIEYDGSAWHKDKSRDIEKNNLCNDNNIKLIRVRENGCPILDSTSTDYYFEKNESFSNLNEIISKIIIDLYNVKIDVDITKERFNIYKKVNYSIKDKSLENMYPAIAKEWDYIKNEKLKPSQFYSHSSKKFWWICSKGHSYNTSIAKRTAGANCPYCSSEKLLKGYNDLATTNPELLEEWDYEKNNTNSIYPDIVSKGCNKKVWWKCKNGHEWEALISNRVRGRNCPYCSGRKKIIGYNDLATTNPEILNMWDYEKNQKNSPNNFSKGSDYKAWWICPSCKNSWQQRISHITKGIGCPICHFSPYK